MKDDEIAKVISHLVNIATYSTAEELRERIGTFIVPILRQVKPYEERDIDIDDGC